MEDIRKYDAMARACMEKAIDSSGSFGEDITDDLLEMVSLATTGVSYGMYLLEVTPIMRELDELMKKPVKICPRTGSKDGVEEEYHLADKFFNVLRKYQANLDFPVPTVEMKTSNVQKCPDCGSVSIHSNDEDLVCSDCSAVIGEVEVFTSYKDVERLHMAPKHSSDRAKTVEEAIRKFQGIGEAKVPEHVIKDVEEKIRVAQMEIDRVTPRTVRDVLKNAKGPRGKTYYDEMIYIWHRITGRPCPDISEIENFVIEDITEMERVHKTLSAVERQGRSSFPNMSYVLRRVMERHGYFFSDGHFPAIKSSDTVNYLATICDTMFLKLGWPIAQHRRPG